VPVARAAACPGVLAACADQGVDSSGKRPATCRETLFHHTPLDSSISDRPRW
jgi:hypothetical protein